MNWLSRLLGKSEVSGNMIRYEEWAGIVKGAVREKLGAQGMSSREKVRKTMDKCLSKIRLTCTGCEHVFTAQEKKTLMMFEAAKHAGLSPNTGQPICPECGGDKGLVEY